MSKSKYSASFTAAALLYPEHLRMEELLRSPDFEERIGKEVEENKYLSIKMQASRKRVVQEVRKRYEAAPEGFWERFFGWKEAEQRLGLFFLCLKTYALMMDYQVEVALKKWRSGAVSLDAFDLQMRLDEIASFDLKVDGWSEGTKRKTITNYIRILGEAGLLREGNQVRPADIETDFWSYFHRIGEGWFIEACFFHKDQI